MIQLIALFASKKKIEFIKLIKKYYSFRYENFDFITIYFIQIKIFEKRIRGINVIFDNDKQILLCLSIIFSKYFQYYIKIWVVTLGMIADKARNMFLEEKKRLSKKKIYISDFEGFLTLRISTQKISNRKVRAVKECFKYGKYYNHEECWELHSKKISEWLQKK